MFFFVLTNDKIDKTRLAKRQTKIKKRERRQNKKQKEHAARSGTRTRDLSHFGFVGDRITRGRSIQPRHLKCRSCSVCLYKAHSERGRSATLIKIKRDSEQLALLSRCIFCWWTTFLRLPFPQGKGPWACSTHLACLSVASAVSWVTVALFCGETTKLEGQRRSLVNGPKSMIMALK